MAGQGRRVTFHGAFSDKADAIRKERQVHGFIKPAMVRGSRRYIVMTNPWGGARGDRPMPARAARASGGGDWSFWLLGAGALALWLLSKAPAFVPTGPTRPATVPLTATAQIASSGAVVGWYLVNADGTTAQWDANGVLA